MNEPILVAGGGIGGLAAALALSQQGFDVKVLEQAAQIGEIGAGIQLGPNAFSAFDALGIGERERARAVYTDRILMMDAVDETEVVKAWGQAWSALNLAPVFGALDADALNVPREVSIKVDQRTRTLFRAVPGPALRRDRRCRRRRR